MWQFIVTIAFFFFLPEQYLKPETAKLNRKCPNRHKSGSKAVIHNHDASVIIRNLWDSYTQKEVTIVSPGLLSGELFLFLPLGRFISRSLRSELRQHLSQWHWQLGGKGDKKKKCHSQLISHPSKKKKKNKKKDFSHNSRSRETAGQGGGGVVRRTQKRKDVEERGGEGNVYGRRYVNQWQAS